MINIFINIKNKLKKLSLDISWFGWGWSTKKISEWLLTYIEYSKEELEPLWEECLNRMYIDTAIVIEERLNKLV